MLGWAVAAFAQTPVFYETRIDLPVQEGPRGVATGFFDLGPHPDIVVLNHDSSTYSVFMGQAGGELLALEEESLAAIPGPSAVEVADVDLDTRPDLVIAHDVASEVSVWLGNADGTFVLRHRTPVGEGPEGVVVGDFNRDGFPDAATADTFGNTVTVLRGFGDGTLDVVQTLRVGIAPCGIASADLNGDAVPDLVVSLNIEGDVLTLRGVGGTFLGPCAGDCNGNGSVTIDELVRGVNIALGGALDLCPPFDDNENGQVTIDELVRGVASALAGCSRSGLVAGMDPTGVLIRDFDGDQVPDIAVANAGSPFVSVFRGFGDGGFDTPRDFAVQTGARGIAAADLNDDGVLDLSVTNALEDRVSVLLGMGNSEFAEAQHFDVHDGPSGARACGGIATADVNGDGLPDLITANEESDDISILPSEAP